MRISDWSSDVCSSDLYICFPERRCDFMAQGIRSSRSAQGEVDASALPRTDAALRRFVAQTENTVPWPTPGPGQERPCAGRSPGSRVNAAMHAFPDLRPVAGPWTEVHRAHRLQLQGQPRNRTVSSPHRSEEHPPELQSTRRSSY